MRGTANRSRQRQQPLTSSSPHLVDNNDNDAINYALPMNKELLQSPAIVGISSSPHSIGCIRPRATKWKYGDSHATVFVFHLLKIMLSGYPATRHGLLVSINEEEELLSRKNYYKCMVARKNEPKISF